VDSNSPGDFRAGFDCRIGDLAPHRIETTATTSTKKDFFAVDENSRHIYFSTNFLDLSKGNGNLGLDFFLNDNMALGLRMMTSSQKEDVRKNGENVKLTVDRTSYSLGTTVFFSGIKSQRSFVLSPALAFGQKRDALDVDNLTGLSLKMTGLLRMKNDLAFEAGVRGDNIDNSNPKGDIYAGFGYIF